MVLTCCQEMLQTHNSPACNYCLSPHCLPDREMHLHVVVYSALTNIVRYVCTTDKNIKTELTILSISSSYQS